MVSIGGRIFLAPLLHLAAVFILVNSLAGIAGQAAKRGGTGDLAGYLPLFGAVIVGGMLGSWLGATRMRQRQLELATAMLVLAVGGQLVYRTVRSLSA